MQVFKSKTDLWLYLLMITSVLVCLAVSVFLALQAGLVNVLLAIFIMLTGTGLPLWILLGTRYVIDGEQLTVTSGPFNWIIPLDAVTSVTSTRSSLSAPALSLDRLLITYAGGRSVMVSPEDKQAFLRAVKRQMD